MRNGFAPRHWFIGGLLTALVSFGVAASANAASSPLGYERVSVRAARISLLLPDTWTISKTTREQAQAVLDANPGLDVTVDDLLRRTPLEARWDGDGDGYSDDG